MEYKISKNEKQLCLRSEKYEDLEEVVSKEFGENSAWILFWEQHRVDFAWYDGKRKEKKIWWPGEKAELKYLLEARLFNSEKEVHVLCGGRGTEAFSEGIQEQEESSFSMETQWEKKKVPLSGRVLEEYGINSDEITEEVYVHEEFPYMWGSQIKENNCIWEERGMHYHLPMNCFIDRSANPVAFGYRVIEYYRPDPEDGMLRLMDYRLAGVYQEVQGKKCFFEEEWKNERA